MPWQRRAKAYWPYLLLAALVMLPLLGRGYILTVDMVFTPHPPMPASVTNEYLFFALLHVVGKLVPAMLIQKILLVGIFVLAGIGMHRLMDWLRPTTAKAGDWRWASYFGGLLYACNPFVYSRLMAGQYLLLLGYALLPWLVRAVWALCRKPTLRAALYVAAWMLLLSIVSLHMLGIGLIMAALVCAGQMWSQRRHAGGRRVMLVYGGLALLVFALASAYWLVPLLLGHGSTASTLASFSQGDVTAFRTVSDGPGLVGTVLALQGFWGDAHNLYLLPQDVSAWWWVPIGLLWCLVTLGALVGWHKQRRRTALFLLAAGTGLVLAVGMAGTLVAPFNRLLVEHVPFFNGYREPQKFAALLALSYAYFGGMGVYWIKQRAGKAWRLAPVLLALPVLCAPYLLWGAHGQLRSQDYPADWYTLNDRLKREDTEGSKALFLPWHLYMPLPFASGTVANPAPSFFSVPIVASNNPEIGQATGYATSPTVRQIDQLLPTSAHNPHMAAQLAQLHIRYIIVAKTLDYHRYDYLQRAPGIHPLSQSPNIISYRVAP